MTKKYKLTEETTSHYGTTLYRIEALRDFGDVKKGDKGGWVESEDNLSHEGDCWVEDDAKVYDKAHVYDNAKIYGEAEVSERAQVYGHAIVFGIAQVYGGARVFGKTWVYGRARVYDSVQIKDNARIGEWVRVHNKSVVGGDTIICGHVEICCPNSHPAININAIVRGDAIITDNSDYITFKNHWSSGRFFVYTKSNKMWSVGCFHGTSEELIRRAYEGSKQKGEMYEKYVRFVEPESWFTRLKSLINKWI